MGMTHSRSDQQSHAEDFEGSDRGAVMIPKKFVFGGLSVILLLFFHYSGLLNRGYESKTIRFSGVSKSSTGSGYGSKRVFLRKGQTFTSDYEVQIKSGGLHIRLHKYWSPPGAPAAGQVWVKKSGNGQLRVPIAETGVYQLWIKGSPDRNGYDLSYTVSWKAE